MGRSRGSFCCLLFASTLLHSQDQIFFNAKIFTADPQHPYAEAVAIRGDKIRAVGNLPEVIKAAAPAATRTDLAGKSLFPGFIDSHSHTIDGGFNLINADATEKVDTFEELRAFVAAAKKTGRGMHGDILEILGLPLKFWSHTDTLNHDFSAGAYEKQCLVFRGMDGHTAWANHAMLQRAGITADYLKALTADQRSYFGYDKDMQPNGFLVDAGQHRVDRFIPPPTDSEILAAGRAALEYNYSLGITAWLEPSAPESTLKAYRALNERGELNNEVVAFPKVLAKDPSAELAFVHKQQQIYGNIPHLHMTGIKIFADGVAEFPSQTAHLTKPYKNSGRNGELLYDQKTFNQLCIAADKEGLIIHVHAIGDGAVKSALDGIAAARAANGDSHLPHTLTHEQFIRPEDFPRFRELGVISALQLYWAEGSNDTIEILKPYVDAEIYRWQYPARSVLDNGGIISGASDWPVSTANIFRAIYKAETRKGNEGILDATQAMPREAMFYAYTRNSAKALNLDSIGVIAPGKRADLVLLDRDVLTVSPDEMEATKVLWTIVAGKMVYKAE